MATKKTTRQIQTRLTELGYNPGPIDNDFGPKTRAAVIAFQKDNGLEPDGIVGPLTTAKLFTEVVADFTIGEVPSLSIERLRKFAPNAMAGVLESFVEGADKMAAAGITTPLRLQHFLAQTATETGGYRALSENLSYSWKRLVQVWPSRFPNANAAAPYAHNPEALANKVYGGRLGNNKTGDGWLFRGGGLIQTTGRSNYAKAGYEHDPDAIRKPGQDSLASALKFWTDNKCNDIADKDDVTAMRKRINGGTNGLEESREWLAKAKQIF